MLWFRNKISIWSLYLFFISIWFVFWEIWSQFSHLC